jgi:hypothetical protein
LRGQRTWRELCESQTFLGEQLLAASMISSTSVRPGAAKKSMPRQIRGIAALHASDDARLEDGSRLFEAAYAGIKAAGKS